MLLYWLRKNTAMGPSMPETEVKVFLQVDELRGSPMSVGSLEEIIDEK